MSLAFNNIPSGSPVLSNPFLEQSISGRAFIVTGGTQGLGLEIARTLKRLGARFIVVVSRSADKGAIVEQELSSPPEDVDSKVYCVCKFLRADLSSADDAQQVIPSSIELLSKATATLDASSTRASDIKMPTIITGLVNAAAITARDNLKTATKESFDIQMNINVRAPMLLTQGFANHLRTAADDAASLKDNTSSYGGSVVNISSVASHGGAPFIMSYSISKAALNCLTKNNAAELAPYRIRVNAVNMGWCVTENEHKLRGPEGLGDPNWFHKADLSCPMGRILRPIDIASTVCYLLSDCSAMITGNTIDVHPDFSHGICSSATEDS